MELSCTWNCPTFPYLYSEAGGDSSTGESSVIIIEAESGNEEDEEGEEEVDIYFTAAACPIKLQYALFTN